VHWVAVRFCRAWHGPLRDPRDAFFQQEKERVANLWEVNDFPLNAGEVARIYSSGSATAFFLLLLRSTVFYDSVKKYLND